jgi:hypothetical protein
MRSWRPELALSRHDDPEDGKSYPASSFDKQFEVFDSEGSDGDVLEERQVDGGSIHDLQSSYVRLPEGYSESRHDGRRRAWIALILFVLLAALICVHYGLIALFAWYGKSDVKSMETAFNTALPVISGLAGTAAAFYFRDRDRSK